MSFVQRSLEHARRRLEGHTPSAGVDARVLLQYCLGRSHAWLLAHPAEPLSAEQDRRYQACVDQRRRGVPVAHLVGQKEFWSLSLEVSGDVLIPRPETELLVEVALSRIPLDMPWRIADLGTGSGAVGLAVARERPHCRILATDASTAALDIARANAMRNGIGGVAFHHGDWFDALPMRQLDMIVSNPPYVADGDPCLRGGDLAFEPIAALRAGPRGLDALSVIAGGAARYLRPEGRLIVEHGHDQQAAVAELLSAGGLHDITCHADHAGHPRVTECRAAA